MSEDSGAVPAPYVLDVSALTAITRGDYGIMTFIQQLDASGQPLVIPVLAMTGAALDLRSDDTEAILHGLERLGNALVAPCGTPSRLPGLPPSSSGPASIRGKVTWPPSRMRPSAPSSPSTPGSGGSTPRTWMTRCTSSRSPTRMSHRADPGGPGQSAARRPDVPGCRPDAPGRVHVRGAGWTCTLGVNQAPACPEPFMVMPACWACAAWAAPG